MSEDGFEPEKFKVFVRYLIQVAKEKRCVPYNELENVFGLSHGQVGVFAGKLGDYCLSRDIAKLNGLIINVTDCVPSHGYDWYHKKYGIHWGEVVTECWRQFHVTSSRQKQVQDFSKRDKDVQSFLDGE
ncbi:hypothetical protein [Solimonas flava]|uniref:hypothetical protein n=1 Tax=Solimonas flava TaxID=415849 RepID=UPI0012B52971|nr:hypothetical protein [Solimonas flava]